MAGKPEYISTDDLVQETGTGDLKQLQRLIRKNQLPQVSRDKPVPRKDAEIIVRRLQRREIDWYKYKQKSQDASTGGPLQRRDFSADHSLVETWYQKLVRGESSIGLPLLGVACSGGFLRGNDDSPFTILLRPGVNILIGHRGSGKSTALTLLTLLSDSTSERADVLITLVLKLLQGDSQFAINQGRRIRHTLLQYEVETYICYFYRDEQLHAFLIKTTDGFDLLQRHNGEWVRVPSIPEPLTPPMQILRQGEVFRIADDRERLVLNNILDGLYPKLYDRRKVLAGKLVKLRQQYASLVLSRFQIDLGVIEDFLGQRFFDLAGLERSSKQIENVPSVIERIESLLYEYDRVEDDLRNQPIVELLCAGESGLVCIYVGRIAQFLRTRIVALRDILHREVATSPGDDVIEPSPDVEDLVGPEFSILGDGEDITPVVELDIKHDESSRQPLSDAPLSRREWHEAVNAQLLEIFSFLRNRLTVIRSLARYWSRMPKYDEKLDAMCTQFTDFLLKQVELINEQEKHCDQISDILREDMVIRLFTEDAARLVKEYESRTTDLINASARYAYLSTATMKEPQRNISDQWTGYMAAISHIHESLKAEEGDEQLFDRNSIFHRVSVELRQGGTFRSFENLSFGQRSGIILMIALRMTDAKVVVIDQPEDNLDASSVVEMIAPTLDTLGKDRVVIVATHNSNLIMGLSSANLIVLESLGEYGRIRVSGTLTSRQEVVRQMLDVLEGGEKAFTEKMRLYEEFASRLQGAIPDVDISLIETSFRRRTIDSLRNFLQPVVSDRSIMDFLRHELKQGSVTRLRSDIAMTGREIETHLEHGNITSDSILSRLDSLFAKFDSHISRMLGAIEQIRLMDTQPHPTTFLLLPILREEAEGYKNRLGDPRHIEFILDRSLDDVEVHVDREHFRLVFRNLFENSLRATERKAAQLLGNRGQPFVETISISLGERRPISIVLLLTDNGIGISPTIRPQLYLERCSDRQGADHGLGGVIIRKLLDVNSGSIEVAETRYNCDSSGTTQRITLQSALL